MSINEVAAQAYTFFFAGFETASTTMNFLLYECAINHELQDRIRQEIDDVLAKFDGNITYESVTEMVYLDRCISGIKTTPQYITLFLLFFVYRNFT